jgi:AraC-like DNA-binding protein
MHLSELQMDLGRHARSDMTTAIDGVFISKVDAPTSPSPSMSGTVLALIAQGAKRLALGEAVYEYRAGQYLVASVDLPVTGHWTEASARSPALGFGLILEPAVTAELLLAAEPEAIPRGTGHTPRGIAVSDASPELLDAVSRLVRLLDRPQDIRTLAPLIKREILWRLMTGEQGTLVRQFGLADSKLTYIGRAVRWIRDHYTQAFRVDDLAQMSGMSASAFYRHFQAVTAMSPIQFQKQIRLQEARLALAIHPAEITGVAYSVGYGSPSQFSRDYRRQFGASPSEDAAQLHTTAEGTALALP